MLYVCVTGIFQNWEISLHFGPLGLAEMKDEMVEMKKKQ